MMMVKIDPLDREYQEWVIRVIEHCDDGAYFVKQEETDIGIRIPNGCPVTPAPGMMIRVYGKPERGGTIRGIVLDGTPLFYFLSPRYDRLRMLVAGITLLVVFIAALLTWSGDDPTWRLWCSGLGSMAVGIGWLIDRHLQHKALGIEE